MLNKIIVMGRLTHDPAPHRQRYAGMQLLYCL